MMQRYADKKIEEIWSNQNWRDTALKFYQHIFTSRFNCKELTKEEVQPLLALKAPPTEERCLELDNVYGHETAAFIEALCELLPPETARHVHFGMTSSDLLDTVFGVQIDDSLEHLKRLLYRLTGTIYDLESRCGDVQLMGRTHGQHAEPMDAYFKFGAWATELESAFSVPTDRLGKYSGPVGDSKFLSQASSDEVTHGGGGFFQVNTEGMTQCVPRVFHSKILNCLASVASVCERIAICLRLLQQTEIGEFSEPFSETQKGSSSMPHKKNPVLCERISGLARIVRGNALVGMENIALWNERDISHSSAEKIVFPQSFHLTAKIVSDLTHVLQEGIFHEDEMLRKVEAAGESSHSQLNRLILEGKSRSEAYAIVQKSCLDKK